MTAVIGLLGPAGSGKSTVAEHLVEKYRAKRYSLAAPLKEIARLAFDLSHEQVYGTQEQKEAPDERYGGKSARWILQRLGTEGIRAVLGQDFWIKFCLETIERDDARIAVVDDLRFANETSAFLLAGAPVIRLRPPGDDESANRASAAGKHASEDQWRVGTASFEYVPEERSVPKLLAFADEVMIRLGLSKIG